MLIFANDFTRPTAGSKSLYISYLISFGEKGQLGTGNDGRYLDFLSSSNLYLPNAAYPYWSKIFNTFGTGANPEYVSHALLDINTTNTYLGAADSSAGKDFSTSPLTAPMGATAASPPGAPVFVVGSYTLNATGSDQLVTWVNPSTNNFGGSTPPSSPAQTLTPAFNISDIGGLCLEDRVGSGALGGVGSNYIVNLLIGSTWSFVTGGPEFTAQPTNSVVAVPGGTVSITATAVAAAQTVSYQWQKNGANLANGSGAAGGSASVSGATTATLTLTGASAGDAGSYTVVATASGTGYGLVSSNSVFAVSDPGVLAQPQPATVNYGGTATFTAEVVTATSGFTYAWYYGSTMLTSGAQADGSIVSGAQGTNHSGPATVYLTLNISNVSCSDDGSYSLIVTNVNNSYAASTAAALAVNDPFIGVQPPAIVEIPAGGTASLPVQAGGTGATYQWYNAQGALSDTGDDSGTATSTLTIANAQASDEGTYYVTVNGTCGPSVTSSNTVVYVDTTPAGLTLTPPILTQQSGTHLALVGTVAGGSGLAHLYLQLNGTNLNAGQQADGSFVFGPGTTVPIPGTGALILSNLQVSDSGTYTVIVSNIAGVVSASSVVKVVQPGQIQLSTNNLIVSRVGEGSQPLSGATGNTLYLDQFATNGGYVNTIQVPDTGPSALVVAGAAVASGNEGAEEAYITTSSNQQFINFGGFCYSYPYQGGADVTIGGAGYVRGIYAVNGAGIMALVYTNYGLYSGGHGFRDVYSTDGLTNFWTTGSASGGTVKYVNAGPAGASYTITTPGLGIPALSAANSGGVSLGLVGSNLVFAENGAFSVSDPSSVWGLDEFSGAPMTTTTASTEILPGGVGHADDFAFSPDQLTVYVADDDFSTSQGGNGGIQRWDNVGGTWTYAYNLSDTTGTGTNGTRGLVAVWPANITSWGQGVQGAVIYATTSETVSNRIIQITDTIGANSPSSLLATAGPNQFYRGIRFGPIQAPLGVTAGPANQTAIAGQSVEISASTTGNFSYYFPNAAGTHYNLISVPPATFQWYQNGAALAGQTNYALSLLNAQASNAGSYTFVMTSGPTTVSNAIPAVLTVSPFTVDSNLVGWFQFADGSGTNAIDSSIYGDTGALYNFPTNNSEWVSGLGGLPALDFANADSNNDNVVIVPDEAQLNFTNDSQFTISAWIKSTTNQSSSAALISKGYGNGGEQYNLDIYNGGYRIFVRNSLGTVSAISTTNAPPVNQWQQVAATFNGSEGLLDLYIDGQLIGSNNAALNSLLYTTLPLTIGNRTSGQGTAYNLPFVGDIQDVRLYDAAFGPQDIAAIYASQNLAASAFPPQLATNPPAAFVGSGQFQLNFTGVAGTSFRLWSTTNLALKPITNTWTLLESGTFGANGSASYIDTSAAGAEKFYTITQP